VRSNKRNQVEQRTPHEINRWAHRRPKQRTDAQWRTPGDTSALEQL